MLMFSDLSNIVTLEVSESSPSCFPFYTEMTSMGFPLMQIPSDIEALHPENFSQAYSDKKPLKPENLTLNSNIFWERS